MCLVMLILSDYQMKNLNEIIGLKNSYFIELYCK